MAKKEDSLKQNDTPDDIQNENDPGTSEKKEPQKYLTDKERSLMERIFDSYESESFPTVTEVVDRILGNELDLTKWSHENPTGVMLPGNNYLWVSDDAMPTELYRLGGGLYDIVNRMNHPHIPSHTFSASGAISVRSQLYLCYTKEDIKAEKDRLLKQQFAMRVENASKGVEKDLGGARLERQDRVPHDTGSYGSNEMFRNGDTSQVE